MIKCTILGSGGSNGVPQIGCNCFVCKSNDPKNARTRASILLTNQTDGTTILIDTSPDLRTQALKNNLQKIDAVLFTHAHFDHISGLDDLKQLIQHNKPAPAFMDKTTAKAMQQKYRYIFEQLNPHYPPLLQKHFFQDHTEFHFKTFNITPFKQQHGHHFSYGFHFGNIAYSTDLNLLNDHNISLLKGVKIWIVDCMRYFQAPTHSHLELTLEWVAKVKPELAILTHMAHEIEYNEISKILPKNVVAAYDSMEVIL